MGIESLSIVWQGEKSLKGHCVLLQIIVYDKYFEKNVMYNQLSY